MSGFIGDKPLITKPLSYRAKLTLAENISTPNNLVVLLKIGIKKEVVRKVKLPIAFHSADQWLTNGLQDWTGRFHNVLLVFIYQCREIDSMKALSPFKSKMNTWLKK